MDWKPLALFTPLFFVLYQTISKTLPKDVSIFLVNAYALFVGFLFMLTLHLLTERDKSLALGTKNLAAILGIGLFISLGNYGVIKAYSLGAPQAIFTALFYVALIIYGVIFGLLFWHERLNAVQMLGIVISIIGLFMATYFRK
ncbi:MAG: EamA family transporter [Patescibacteria group bacterium]